jgi:hypothetical protein
MGGPFSASASGVFRKLDCGVGCVGSEESFTAMGTSDSSQAAADQAAQEALATGGPAHASSAGTCACVPTMCDHCESFQNHGPATPHLFASARDNAFVGEVFADCVPYFQLEGLMPEQEPMTAICPIPGSSKFLFRYTKASDGAPHNAHLQTHGDGCMDYPDIREQRVYPDKLVDWIPLPSLDPVAPSTEDILFFVSSDLTHDGEPPPIPAPALTDHAPVWTIGTQSVVDGLKFRVDGGGWVDMVQATWGYVWTRPPFDITQTPEALYPAKDFIFDVTHDGGSTAQRFTVYRTFQGGHYSVVTTMTRQDGHVYVTEQSVNVEVPQKLVNKATGATYEGNAVWHSTFDMGVLDDGDHEFALYTYNNVYIDDILVRVKRTM